MNNRPLSINKTHDAHPLRVSQLQIRNMAAPDPTSKDEPDRSGLPLQNKFRTQKSRDTPSTIVKTESRNSKPTGTQKSTKLKSPPKNSPQSVEPADVWCVHDSICCGIVVDDPRSDDEYYVSAKLGRTVEASKRLQKELYGDTKPVMENELEVGPEIEKDQ